MLLCHKQLSLIRFSLPTIFLVLLYWPLNHKSAPTNASIRRCIFSIFIFSTSAIFIQETKITFPFTQWNAMGKQNLNSMSILSVVPSRSFVMVRIQWRFFIIIKENYENFDIILWVKSQKHTMWKFNGQLTSLLWHLLALGMQSWRTWRVLKHPLTRPYNSEYLKNISYNSKLSYKIIHKANTKLRISNTR